MWSRSCDRFWKSFHWLNSGGRDRNNTDEISNGSSIRMRFGSSSARIESSPPMNRRRISLDIVFDIICGCVWSDMNHFIFEDEMI
jgi:hypothetical protein